MQRRHAMPFGAECRPEGVRFRLWAPQAQTVELALAGRGRAPEVFLPMAAIGAGWYELVTDQAGPGSRYGFRIDAGMVVPDPASRYQPDGVHGLSEVIDPGAHDWPDNDWAGRPWDEAVIYELHVGTFTDSGDFNGVAEKLDHLVALGVTAIELMPLSDFPGQFNWGYDGVLPFAPARAYGRPADLKALVAAAHARGLMVLLDVVYNHFGPEGNYLHVYAEDFFTHRHPTPWGPGVNVDGKASRPVREFIIHNVLYWLEEYGIDGLRLDAVHAIADDSEEHLLDEIARRVQAGPGAQRFIHLVLENDNNEAHRLARRADGRPAAYTAQWNDDIHHVLHVLATGESDGYYQDYQADPARDLGQALAEGFVYQGEPSPFRAHKRRGEPSGHLPPAAFVAFAQNHDQIGNRAQGERLIHLVGEEPSHAIAAIVLLAPQIPLLFMGEEWGASSPFLFFSDFEPELQRKVAQGRKHEFKDFKGFRGKLPDPGDPATVARARLVWGELDEAPHAGLLAWHKRLLAVRQREIVPLTRRLQTGAAHDTRLPGRGLQVTWPLSDGGQLVLVANPGPEPTAARPPHRGRPLLQTGTVAADTLGPWAVVWLHVAPHEVADER